jgi:hypothetical protein
MEKGASPSRVLIADDHALLKWARGRYASASQASMW